MNRAARNRMAELADLTLSALLLVDQEWTDPTHQMQEAKAVDRAALRNIWPSDFVVIDGKGADDDDSHPEFLLPKTGTEAAELSWPLDISYVIPDGGLHDTITNVVHDAIVFKRLATIKPPDVRGITKLVPQKMLALSSACIVGTAHNADLDLIGLIGGKWQQLPLVKKTIARGNSWYSIESEGGYNNARINNEVILVSGVKLTTRYNWHIAIGFSETGPRVLFPTSARGAIVLLQNRELEPGRSRRQAIRHWVSEHWRDNSYDEGALIYVRKHLRGHTQFIWNGLFAEVLVSEYDLEKNELFKQEAALWRARRKHNRVHVRLKKWHLPSAVGRHGATVWY